MKAIAPVDVRTKKGDSNPGKHESDDSPGHAARTRPVRRVRPLRLARFHEDMKVPDWFDPGQVDVSDSACPPRGYPPNVDSLSSLGVPAWRTIASQ